MQRLLRITAVGHSRLSHLAETLVLLLAIACSFAHAQDTSSGEYKIYTLRHRTAAEIKGILGSLLSDAGMSAHLVSDAEANQILLRGPEEAQRIAAQLIREYDHAPKTPSTTSPRLRTYPCDRERLPHVAKALQAIYGQNSDISIAADPAAEKLIVIASDEVHAAIPGQLTALAASSLETGTAARPSATAAARPTVAEFREQFVPVLGVHVQQVESSLRAMFGGRLLSLPRQEPNTSRYEFTDSVGRRVQVDVDFRRNGFRLLGPAPLVDQWGKLIATFTTSSENRETAVRVLPVYRADPVKVREAVRAFRQGQRGGGTTSPRSAPASSLIPAPDRESRGGSTSLPAKSDFARVQPVSYIFQEQPAPETAGGDDETASQDLDQRRERLRELGIDVEVETLPDLDVIILRGRDRDVQELSRIIEEIERLSAETQPTIELVPLRHVRGEAMVAIINQVSPDLVGGRQGRVSVTPLAKPNSLLLIGWGDAVNAIQELIEKLDQPVAPETQLRVFRLRNAAVGTARTTVEQFFSGRTGLGPRVLAIADLRTNSLVVQASPRDMDEVAVLIERLDGAASSAVNQARVFRLRNALAADVGETLQKAIDAARGGTAQQKSAVLELLTIDAQTERVFTSGDLSDVQVTTDPRTNTLLVTAPAESMDLLAALVEHLDQPASTAQIKVFRIVNGDANSMIEMLRSLLPAQAGPDARPQLPGAEGESSLVPLRFSVDVRTNSIIATGSAGDLKIIEALLLRLDEKDVQQRKNTVYRLRNAPAIDVAQAINDFLRSERQVQLAAPGTASPFQQIEREVVVVPEPVSNSLILSATPRFFDDIMELVKQLDDEPPKVMIQVLIAEVTLGNASEFGVELGLQDSLLFDRSLLGDLVTITNTTQESTAAGIVTDIQQQIVGASNTPGFNFNSREFPNSASDRALANSQRVGGQGLSNFAVGRVNSELGFGGLVLSASSESVSVLVRALQESRRLEILSRPQIMTLDNQPAFIQVGQRVPRIVGTTINMTGQVNNIALENVGLILGVTPRISPDGMVVMEIDAEKSHLGPEIEGIPVAVSEGEIIRSPRIDLTTAQTTVSAANGETIVLGGLITKRHSTVNRRVPGLSDIPLLGLLFQYDSEICQRTELLIILTPHIVRNAQDAARIKHAEAARMHWCLASVTEMQGTTGIYPCDAGMVATDMVPTIFPGKNPRGIMPEPPRPNAVPPSCPAETLEPIPAPHGFPGFNSPRSNDDPPTMRQEHSPTDASGSARNPLLPGPAQYTPTSENVVPADYLGPVAPSFPQPAARATPTSTTWLDPQFGADHRPLDIPIERLPNP